ncbi:MAG: hypothetical protein MJE77_08455 [Proteobacteria bacterium]|nr:hypothetical protein [Pseudomonadota bacterium]
MTQKKNETIDELSKQKFDKAAQIRDLRAEIGRINVKLHEAGADAALIACW